MGSVLKRRLSNLQQKTDSDDLSRLRLFRTFLLSFIGLWVFYYLVPELPEANIRENSHRFFSETDSGKRYEKLLYRLAEDIDKRGLAQSSLSETPPLSEETSKWRANAIRDIIQRYEWLNSGFVSQIAANQYKKSAKSVFSVIAELQATREQIDLNSLFNIDVWMLGFMESLSNSILKGLFILFAFWPLWLFAVIAGLLTSKVLHNPRKSRSILGVLDRNKGPFYSGIYGPLEPNQNISGTDLGTPGLACPQMAPQKAALGHSLTSTLKEFNAFNQTNFALIRIIIAYRDFPAFVAKEPPLHEEPHHDDGHQNSSNHNLVSNAGGTIENNASSLLPQILKAHLALSRFYRNQEKPQLAPSENAYKMLRAKLAKSFQKASSHTQLFGLMLTPARGRALGSLPPTVVATAYLAIEAGKCLVYRKTGNAFSAISRFPNLQARAILHSLPTYHKEYKGDGRLIIRQAIVCSRRHGDIDRAFLPISMPMPARALRDWLEVLYTAADTQNKTAELCELDAHIEEIYFDFKKTLSGKMEERVSSETRSPDPSPAFKSIVGFVYASLVLVPFDKLLELTLAHVGKSRLARISKLLENTRKERANFNHSSRLPGVGGENIELEIMENAGQTLLKAIGQKDKQLKYTKWCIVRRLLLRYNWLSTRVGDFKVPADGLVSGIVVDRSSSAKPEIIPFSGLVPLRQRRYKELFGENWERLYYFDTPHPQDTEVFVNHEDFITGVKSRQIQCQQGVFENNPLRSVSLRG